MHRFSCIRVSEFGSASVLQMGTSSLNEPKGKQILMKLSAAGVNPVDTYQRSGNYAQLPQLPFTPGKDGAGIVLSVGQNVTKFKEGDRVYCINSISGTYSQYALSEEDHVGRLDDKTSFEEGACLGVPYYTAYRALFHKGNSKKGETVLIHGASGGVGIGCIQFAKNKGLKVIGTAGTESGLKLIEEQGADVALNHNSVGYMEQIMKESNGKGVDIIIENLANVNLGNDLKVLAKGGRVVIVGSRGNVEISPRDIMAKEAIVTGMMLANATKEEISETEESIYNGLKDGFIKPSISKIYPLQEAYKAHEEIIPSGKPSGATGKIILQIN